MTIHLYRAITGGIEIFGRPGDERLILTAKQARALADLTARHDWKIAAISPTGEVSTSKG